MDRSPAAPKLPREEMQIRQYKKKLIVVFEKDERREGCFDFAKATPKYAGGEWEYVLNIDAVRSPQLMRVAAAPQLPQLVQCALVRVELPRHGGLVLRERHGAHIQRRHNVVHHDENRRISKNIEEYNYRIKTCGLNERELCDARRSSFDFREPSDST